MKFRKIKRGHSQETVLLI